MFAKLFGDDDHQVLMVLESNDEDNPCITVSCQPPDMGVCSSRLIFNDWTDADEAFALMDEIRAQDMAGGIRNLLANSSGKSS